MCHWIPEEHADPAAISALGIHYIYHIDHSFSVKNLVCCYFATMLQSWKGVWGEGGMIFSENVSTPSKVVKLYEDPGELGDHGLLLGRCHVYNDTRVSQQTQYISKTFIQRRPNVFDVVPTSHKCCTNVSTHWGGSTSYSLSIILPSRGKMTKTL